jgi:predicted RNA polymerase sigma factor
MGASHTASSRVERALRAGFPPYWQAAIAALHARHHAPETEWPQIAAL